MNTVLMNGKLVYMRDYLETVLIDGKPILMPDRDAEISRADIDAEDSGRDETGVMHRFVLRERVKTWSFSWAHLTAEEYNYLTGLVAGRPTFTFSTFGEEYTAYCSNDTVALRNIVTGHYTGFSMKIIEC